VRTKAGGVGRVMRMSDDGSVAYVQLDEKPSLDGARFDVSDLELLPAD
jgi:hypothetical protein